MTTLICGCDVHSWMMLRMDFSLRLNAVQYIALHYIASLFSGADFSVAKNSNNIIML